VSIIEARASKACFITLGCKVNQAESEALAQLLIQHGYIIVDESEEPDAIIINTCTVTATGSGKSRKTIRKIVKDHPNSTVVVMGCYSQLNPAEVAELEGVDLIVGTQDRLKVVEFLLARREQTVTAVPDSPRRPVQAVKAFTENTVYEELPLVEKTNRARAMLKIQDGCSQFCTYCIIPYARGPSRSRDPQSIISEAEKLLNSGYKELVLTGIHIGAYGNDLSPKISLTDLIKRLLELKNIKRLRLGSIEPLEFTDELLELAATSEVICPHFHIPLQSGSDRILAKMKRPYTTAEYAELLARIRKRLPEAAIAADVMTGFPGETEQDHQTSLEFIAGCNFAGIHVFPYSRRSGTPAAEMPDQIPKNVKAARVRDILKIGLKSRHNYIEKFLGRKMEVLLEQVNPDEIRGHTRNYLDLRLPPELNPGNWQPGDLVECVLRKEYLTEMKEL